MTRATLSRSPRQTGVQGSPREPFIVSAAVVGVDGPEGPDLRVPATDLRECVDGLKRNHRQRGWLAWDTWILARSSPDGASRSFTYEDGEVDEGRWEEALAGVPERFDHVVLDSDPWGAVSLWAPDPTLHNAQVRSLTARLRTPAAGVDEASGALLGWLVRAAQTPGVQSGFVHVDSIGDPYGQVVAGDARLSRNRFDVEVHGYYWAVLLTDGHVETLGGLDRIRREAPCTRIDELERGGQSGVLCGLTGSALDLDEERVLAWRQFLLPVLREGYPGFWEDIGVPNTNLARPLWLFEGDPVPELTRFVLEHGHEPSGPIIPAEWSDDVECPEAPTCWCYPGPGFDRDRHTGAVNAVINAWLVIGLHGRFFETPGTVRRATAAAWETDDDGVEALVWQVDTGSCDPVAVVRLLVAALSDLAAVLDEGGGPVIERLRIG